MKKISMLFLSLALIVLATGCGLTKEEKGKEQTLVCNLVSIDEDISTEQIISMTFKNDELTHMNMEINATITSSDIIKNWETFKETMAENNQEFNEDGASMRVEIDDQNYKYNTIVDIDLGKVSDEVLEELDLEEIKDDAGTLEANKDQAEQEGYTCIVK